ncbi:7 transmembrane receptor [Oesophagostomum dentatum]|uniref:7 transmembrane receptor n=1 Tax=Oesophagostomum dentatum TaxID=61180 RepID=A0A0B1TQC7_OESDE|nr:7 transmembrane receptor [Oesophagostomum dentatum]
MWASTLNFLLALLIFGFNLLLLIAISSDTHLHSTTHLLSCNLWLCNCISATVAIFFRLTPSYQDTIHCPVGNTQHFIAITHDAVQHVASWSDGWRGVQQFGVHAAAMLLNSTVSLLTLLTMGVVHALCRKNLHLSKRKSSRLLASSWILVAVLLLADFLLIRTSRSLILAVPFHLALLTVFLLLNLIVHSMNLILLSRDQPQSQESEHVRILEDSATAALWLLLSSLSFTVLLMTVLWESKKDNKNDHSLMEFEMVAYSVHCIANPLVAVVRDRRLVDTLTHILLRDKRRMPFITILV